MTPYEWAYAYVSAYEDERWGRASAGHWGRLEAIAQELQRGEYGKDRAKILLSETLTDMRADTL